MNSTLSLQDIQVGGVSAQVLAQGQRNSHLFSPIQETRRDQAFPRLASPFLLLTALNVTWSFPEHRKNPFNSHPNPSHLMYPSPQGYPKQLNGTKYHLTAAAQSSSLLRPHRNPKYRYYLSKSNYLSLLQPNKHTYSIKSVLKNKTRMLIYLQQTKLAKELLSSKRPPFLEADVD